MHASDISQLNVLACHLVLYDALVVSVDTGRNLHQVHNSSCSPLICLVERAGALIHCCLVLILFHKGVIVQIPV